MKVRDVLRLLADDGWVGRRKAAIANSGIRPSPVRLQFRVARRTICRSEL